MATNRGLLTTSICLGIVVVALIVIVVILAIYSAKKNTLTKAVAAFGAGVVDNSQDLLDANEDLRTLHNVYEYFVKDPTSTEGLYVSNLQDVYVVLHYNIVGNTTYTDSNSSDYDTAVADAKSKDKVGGYDEYDDEDNEYLVGSGTQIYIQNTVNNLLDKLGIYSYFDVSNSSLYNTSNYISFEYRFPDYGPLVTMKFSLPDLKNSNNASTVAETIKKKWLNVMFDNGTKGKTTST